MPSLDWQFHDFKRTAQNLYTRSRGGMVLYHTLLEWESFSAEQLKNAQNIITLLHD